MADSVCKGTSRAVRRDREQAAAALLVARSGRRPYQIATEFMRRCGGSRRTADRYLSRAREALAASAGVQIADLSASLPVHIRAALDDARRNKDRRVTVRLLRLIADLRASTPLSKDGPAALQAVEFCVVDSPDGGDTPAGDDGEPGNR